MILTRGREPSCSAIWSLSLVLGDFHRYASDSQGHGLSP